MSVLEVSEISKSFGGVHALSKVSFAIESGELLAMIGPNGAGKSTCFNCINGQIRPDAGTVRFNGQDIIGNTPRRIWHLGVGRTFQIAMTFGSMSVVENVQMCLLSLNGKVNSFWSRAGNQYRDEALMLLSTVGIEDQADRKCSVLAYGDLKRVELAMALAHEPELLLMDEPTAGMAPAERIDMMLLTEKIVGERNISVLFTEHDMDAVFGHASRIIVLNRGELVAQGSPAEVRANKMVQEIYLGAGTTFEADSA